MFQYCSILCRPNFELNTAHFIADVAHIEVMLTSLLVLQEMEDYWLDDNSWRSDLSLAF